MAETRTLVSFLSPLSFYAFIHSLRLILLSLIPTLRLTVSVFVPSENIYKEKIMKDKNIDFCGILNLPSALKKAGFPKAELEQVAVRIAMQTGATIPISF